MASGFPSNFQDLTLTSSSRTCKLHSRKTKNSKGTVLTGKEDVLIAPENSRILAERILNAQLQMIEGGGHQFLVEQAHAFNAAVLKFLTSLS